MSFLEAIILGIVQGLTEFLPISSSGHLMLGERLFGFEEPNLLFNLVVHLGTLVAVTLFYRKDVWGAVTGFWNALQKGLQERSIDAFRQDEGAKLGVLIILGTIPTVVVGLLFYPLISAGFGDVDMAVVISAILILTGFILFSARFVDESKMKERGGGWTLWNITPMVAILIGVAQGLAVLPGFSRSGLTIVAALWLAVYRVEAARYSFLLSIPAVAGALVLESYTSFDAQALTGVDGLVDVGIYTVAGIIAGVIGYLSILVLVKMLRKAQFWHFAWYCWAVGAAGLVYFLVW